METLKYFHRPTISESLGNGWFTLKKYFLWLFLAIIVCAIVSGPHMNFKFDNNSWSQFGILQSSDLAAGITIVFVMLALLALAVFLLVRPVIFYGTDMMFVQAIRDEKPELQLLFQGFRQNYLNIVLAHLLKTAIIAIGFFALIVPGIIFACRLSFVSYLVMDKNMDPIRAIEESWRLTRGYGWTIFGLGFVSFFIGVFGLAMLIVGIFPAIILINAAFASMYQAVLNVKEDE